MRVYRAFKAIEYIKTSFPALDFNLKNSSKIYLEFPLEFPSNKNFHIKLSRIRYLKIKNI